MDKKKKNIIMIVTVALIVITFFSFSYAALTFRSTSFNQQLVLGDIWMKYDESNGFSIEDAVPGSDYSNYFEFTISGKNTYTKKDIYYDFILNRGDLPTNKTEENRIPDKYLKFKLVSVDTNNQETEIFTDKTYASLNNQRIHVETIEKNTTSEVNRKYRLYMTIDNSLEIGNLESAVFTMDEWEQAFASIKVNVRGDFTEKEVELTASKKMLKAIESNTDASCNPIVEEDGIIYFSGSNDCIDFNYVWYSGKLWRITAIYPDGSMKMITQDMITTINWGEKATISDTDLTSTYSTSWIREWLNQEFIPTLYNYENIIDIDAGWYSISVQPAIQYPPEKPTGEYTLTEAVGLLNVYEYMKSYQNIGSYSNGYLNIGYNWWLITPFVLPQTESYILNVIENGAETGNANPLTTSLGVRPVVNLKDNIEFNGGLGTIGNPFKIKGDIEEAKSSITLLNTRECGEYIKIEGNAINQVFRIVDKEKIGEKLTTKVVLNDYVRESGAIITKALSNQYINSWSEHSQDDPTYWRGYLNTTWLQNFNTNMLEKGIYYLGEYYKYYDVNTSYKTTVCSADISGISIKECIENDMVVSDIVTDDYVGLLRIGEMFASQFGAGSSSSSDMWMISPPAMIYKTGYLSESDPPISLAARPTINLTNTIVIKSGTGTELDPFIVGLPN